MHQLPDDRLADAYSLDEVIQSGESTVVYRGHARGTGDPIVAKVLHLPGGGLGDVYRLRFLKAVSNLIKHAPGGSPPLKDASWTGDFAVLVFVPVPGTRLTQLAGLSPAQGCHLLSRAGVALHTLHQAGIAHLNLAPDNFLVASSERVFITGLGWGFLRLPTSGAGFAAPELRKALDLAEPQRCDVFSLAFLAAAFFDATVRFGEEEAEVALPEALGQQLENVGALEAVLAQSLHQDPFERPASVMDLVAALQGAVPAGSLEGEGTARLSMEKEEEGKARVFPKPSGPEGTSPEVTTPSSPEMVEPTSSVPEGPSLALPPPPVTEEPSPKAPEPSAPEQAAAPEVMPSATGEGLEPARPLAAAGVPLEPAPSLAGGRKLRWVLGAAMLALVASLIALWVTSHRSPIPAAPTPVPAPPPPPAYSPSPMAEVSPLEELFEEARGAVARGDLEQAKEALAKVSAESLSPENQARFRELAATVQRLEAEQVLLALRAAWKSSNFPALRTALRRLSSIKTGEEGLSPEDQNLIRQAQNVQSLLTRLRQSESGRNWEGVFASAQELEKLLPGTREVAQAQETAAQALESQAQILEKQGNLAEALASLQILERYWPARPGLAEKLAQLRQKQERLQQLRRLADKASKLGEEGKPELGLSILGELPPEQARNPEVASLRERLARQLAALDAAPPSVAPPAAGYKWEYSKGQVAKIDVTVSDDHAVARVTMFFRKKGEEVFRSLPMSKTSAGTYVGEVVPAVHGDQDLQFYVLAEDFSGHQGKLGSPEKPLEVKRKRRLFGL